MPQSPDANSSLERFRAYLKTLQSIHLDPRLHRRFDLPDVIQETLVKAYKELDLIQGLDEEKQKDRLRLMLLNTLRDEIARHRALGSDGKGYPGPHYNSLLRKSIFSV